MSERGILLRLDQDASKLPVLGEAAMPRVLAVILGSFLLSACASQPSTTIVPTLTPSIDNMTATATSAPTRQPPVMATPTTASEARSPEYTDRFLCFAVEVPADWSTDGGPGGFASFTPKAGQASFSIVNVWLEEVTLAQALANVQRGPLGPHIQEVKNFIVGGQPALWVTFTPDAGFAFVVLVIAPDCGDGLHALFIYPTGADERQFQMFLNRVRFTR